MKSTLPFDPAISKAVQDFGVGTYDSDGRQEDEDQERRPGKKSLPDGGGSVTPDGPDSMTSYPLTSPGFAFTYAGLVAASLPGDLDRPPRGRRPADDALQSVVPSVSQTKLPSDSGNPSARSDYYDRMCQGIERALDPTSDAIWADEDAGAYASESLPTPVKNDKDTDNSLGALGNAWSGRTVEDVSNAEGFPSTDYSENVDFPRDDLDGGGKIMTGSRRVSTDVQLVVELADGLVKRYGKKDLTRRHVLAYLKEVGRNPYFASDVIRCLKLSHGIHIKDVMDAFPVMKTASAASIAALRDSVVDLELLHMADPETSFELRRCAASLSDIVAVVDRQTQDRGQQDADEEDGDGDGGKSSDEPSPKDYESYVKDSRSRSKSPVSFGDFVKGKH